MYNENKTLGEVLSNSFSNLLSSAGSGIKSLFTDNRAQEALAFQHDEVKETPFEWSSLKVIRWIFQITTGILSYYGAMHILQEPIIAVSPESGLLIARVISLFLVVAFEIAVFATTKRATFHWLKTTHKHYKNVGKALAFTVLLVGLCYVSWRAAQEGALDIVIDKAIGDSNNKINDKKVGDLAILESQHKSSRASLAKMYNESVRSAEQALAEYSKAGKTADGKPTWRNPATVDKLTASVESAKRERKEAMANIDAEYKQSKAEIEAGAAIPLADNSTKQSIYQRNIWWFSILLEFFRCLCVYLVVKGVYLYKPSSGQRPQQRQMPTMFDMVEPQIFAEKKTFNQTPIPTPIVEEIPAAIGKPAPSISSDKDWIEEYAKLLRNRASYASRIRKATKQGEYYSMQNRIPLALNSWRKNEPLIEEVCEALNRSYNRPPQPKNVEFTKTSP